MPFRFRLERIRRLRQREEDAVARELAVLLGRRARLLARLDTLGERREELLERRSRIQRGRLDPAAVTENGRFIDLLGRSEGELRRKIETLDEEIAGKREQLLEKSRKRKALDRLEERRREEYRLEASREETREADEIHRNRRGMGIA